MKANICNLKKEIKMLRPVYYYCVLIYLPAVSTLNINLTQAYFPHPTVIDYVCFFFFSSEVVSISNSASKSIKETDILHLLLNSQRFFFPKSLTKVSILPLLPQLLLPNDTWLVTSKRMLLS